MSENTKCSNAAIRTVPGGSATVVLFDSTADPGTGTTLTRRRAYGPAVRALVRIFMDQAATFFTADLTVGSSTFRVYNGNGAGEPIAANTWFERDVLLTSDDHKIYVTTVTGPAVWEVSLILNTERTVAQ